MVAPSSSTPKQNEGENSKVNASDMLRRLSLKSGKDGTSSLSKVVEMVSTSRGSSRPQVQKHRSSFSVVQQGLAKENEKTRKALQSWRGKMASEADLTHRKSAFLEESIKRWNNRRLSKEKPETSKFRRMLRRHSSLLWARNKRSMSLDAGRDSNERRKRFGARKPTSLLKFYVELARMLDNNNNEPLTRFRRAVRIVQTLLRALTTSDREARLRNSELKFLLYAADDSSSSSIGGSGLYFDPSYYRAKKDMQLSQDAKLILSMPPEERTEEQKKVALLSLKNAVEAFAEFPIRMQRSLVSVGWYESYEASRVIIRQGHHAENFYMILTGTAVVTISSQDPKTGETRVQTVAFLKKGNSFGELAIMHHSRRTATVSCQDGVELLALGREDFVDIFMHRGDGDEPEFIQYLRTVEEFNGWPIYKLPQDDPKICLYMFFRRGSVICKDSNTAEWIYVVKSGTCRVLKKLQAARPDIRGLRSLVPDAQMQLVSPRSRSTTSMSRNTPFPKVHRSRPCTQPDNPKPSPELQRKKSLPSIRIKSPSQVDREREDFEKRLEDEKLEKKLKHVVLRDNYSTRSEGSRPAKTVYVQLQKLVEKDTFGLTQVILGEIEGGSMSTTLVSNGAECILINKKYFLQHLTQQHRKKLRLMLRPFPTETSLQQRLQDQTNWQAYKTMMLSSFGIQQETLFL